MGSIKERILRHNKYVPLFKQLVLKDIKLKYRRSFLGYLWSIMNPLIIMIIMVIVFSNMFRFDIENYPVYLIIGQTIFSFVSEATNQAMWSITGNAALIKKTYVPKYIFTWSKVTSSFVNTLFALGAMLIVFLVCKVHFNVYMFFIPVVLLQVYVFSLGLGLFIAQANVFFRDVQYIYAALLTVWMYLTPIFYPLSGIPKYLANGIKVYNPIYFYMTQFRDIVLQQTFPSASLINAGILWALGTFLVGTLLFVRTQDKFILYI
jgi:hypothetical protein